jgi:predicted nuclease of predicted toxin-antitoxin system
VPGVCGGSGTKALCGARVKLLLDENLSDRIVARIVDLFPQSAHVKAVGLKQADDSTVSAWAKQHGFTIVSKDTDFYQRSIVFGHPPKFVWLRVGNCPTSFIVNLLRSRHEVIRHFIETEPEGVLILERPEV